MRNSTSKAKIAENALQLYGNYKAQGGTFKADVYKLRTNPDRVTIRFLWTLCCNIGCRYADFFRHGNGTMANLPVGPTGLKRISNQMDALGMDLKDVADAINVRPSTLGTFFRTGYHPSIKPEVFEALLNVLQVTPSIYAGKEAEPEKEPEPVPEQKQEPQQDLFSEYCRPSDILIECNGKWYRSTGWVEVNIKEAE